MPFSRLSLALALSMLGLTLTAQDAPWTVFNEEAIAHAETDVDSAEITRFSEGDAVSGEIWTHPETDEEWLVFEWEDQTAHLSMTHLHRVHPSNLVEGDLTIGDEIVDRWWGLPLDYEASDLVEIPSRFVSRDDRTLQLRREARDALVAMFEAALADDVDIQVNSAYRSGSRQRSIYRRNVRRNPGQRSSARPGHSEHQLGTTVDLTDPPGEYGFSQGFVDTPQGQWLEQHAGEFGFRRTYYPENDEETGYIPEPWHWRYMGDSVNH